MSMKYKVLILFKEGWFYVTSAGLIMKKYALLTTLVHVCVLMYLTFLNLLFLQFLLNLKLLKVCRKS